MMIVWGHNNFKLKSVHPTEIGILDPSVQNYTFELRQKYGHLFWIPFIPLGKMWVLNKGGGNLFQCSSAVEQVLKQQYPARTSIWAWTGPLIILVGIFIFNISSSLQERRWREQAKEAYANVASDLEENVKNAAPGDYFLFSVKEKWEKEYSYKKFPLKVLKASADSISFVVSDKDFSSEKSVEEESDLVMTNTTEAEIVPDVFTISKAALKNAICSERDNEKNFTGILLKDFRAGANCMLKEVMHVEGPIPELASMDADKRDDEYFELVNKGFNAMADSIVSTEPSVEWKLSRQRNFRNGDIIAVKCPGTGSAVLYCSDDQKKTYRFKLSHDSYRVNISKLDRSE